MLSCSKYKYVANVSRDEPEWERWDDEKVEETDVLPGTALLTVELMYRGRQGIFGGTVRCHLCSASWMPTFKTGCGRGDLILFHVWQPWEGQKEGMQLLSAWEELCHRPQQWNQLRCEIRGLLWETCLVRRAGQEQGLERASHDFVLSVFCLRCEASQKHGK